MAINSFKDAQILNEDTINEYSAYLYVVNIIK